MRDQDPRFVIYANWHRPPDIHPRCHVVIFPAAYQALIWLERMLGNTPHSRESDTILMESGVKLRSDQLDQILQATKEPWELPDHYAQWILRFKYGTWDEVPSVEVEVVAGEIVEKTKKPPREKKPQRPEGYVTVTELVAGKNIKPMNARAALRASGLTKPEYGWAWPKSELPGIRKIIGI